MKKSTLNKIEKLRDKYDALNVELEELRDALQEEYDNKNIIYKEVK